MNLKNMTECDNSTSTSAITTLQHFATLNHTSPNYTLVHLSTLHFLSFKLHYCPIWLNPSTFPIVLFHLTQNPFTALKDLSTFHFTSLFIFIYLFIFFTYSINPSLHFALLFTSTTHFPCLHFLLFITLYEIFS